MIVVNVHDVKKATAKFSENKGTRWVTIDAIDKDDVHHEIVLFLGDDGVANFIEGRQLVTPKAESGA